jgi:hypothetical protein
MPIPIPQPVTECAAPVQANTCRLFVSYSHHDSEQAKTFVKFLRLMLRGMSSLGIREEHIFFDRDKLLAGDDWDDSIQRALEQAQVFVLLISADSLDSKYCLTRELAVAVGRGLPILLIILKPCPWERELLPSDPQRRALGALGALPKDNEFGLRPVSQWPGGPEDAWNTVVQQLGQRLQRDYEQYPLPAIIVPLTATPQAARLSALLPYFCNQVGLVNGFNGRVRTWNSPSLLVLMRGCHADNVPRFWDRLRVKNLADYLSVRNGQLLEPRRLVWPQDNARRRVASELASDMLGALSEALTGNPFQMKDAAALGDWLSGLRGVVPLVTTLPQERKPTLALGLRTLLDLIEQCPPQTPVYRLVVAVVIEGDALSGAKDLVRSLKLPQTARTLVVDLEPLDEIGQDDIRNWHRDHGVDAMSRISEEEMLDMVLNDRGARLRLRQFEMLVKPILGL